MPPKPADFVWHSVYRSLKMQFDQAHERADWCAIRAHSDAIAAIGDKVMEQHRSVLRLLPPSGSPARPEAAYDSLLRHWDRIWKTEVRLSASAHGRGFAIGKALGAIDRFTHRKDFELGLRTREFEPLLTANASPGGPPARVPDRRALNYWIWRERSIATHSANQALREGNRPAREAAVTQVNLLIDLNANCERGRDPWSVSRMFIRNAIETDCTDHVVRQLEALHDRLLHAMVDRRLSSGRIADIEAGYDWKRHYTELQAQLEQCRGRGDAAGTDARRTAVAAIDAQVHQAMRQTMPDRDWGSSPHSENCYAALTVLASVQEWIQDLAPSMNFRDYRFLFALEGIHDVTRKILTELAAGIQQFPASPGASLPRDEHPGGTD